MKHPGLHIDVFLGIPILVCAHMVADDVLVVPAPCSDAWVLGVNTVPARDN